MSDHLSRTALTTASNGKEAIIDANFGLFDSALTEQTAIDVSAANVDITVAQIQGNALLSITGATTAGRTATLLGTKKRVFLVSADSANTENVDLVRGATTVTLEPGSVYFVILDGTTDGIEVFRVIGSADDFVAEAPIDGTPYARQDGGWVPAASGSGSTDPEDPHRYWRLYFQSVTSGTWVRLDEVEFKADAAGADLTGAGTASASSESSATYNAGEAFDNNSSSYWYSDSGDVAGAWLAYDFGAGNDVSIGCVTIEPNSTSYAPTAFIVQFSDDGTNWHDAWDETGVTWSTSAVQTFEAPYVQNIPDMPAIESGDAGKILAVNATENGAEWITLPDSGGGGGGGGGGSTLERTTVSLSTDLTPSGWTVVTWDTELLDEIEAWDAAAGSRLTIPAGVSYVRVGGKLAWSNTSTSGRYATIIQYDSSDLEVRRAAGDIRAGMNETFSTFVSPWLPVSEGDYFVMQVNNGSSGANLEADGFGGPAYFWMEAQVEPAAPTVHGALAHITAMQSLSTTGAWTAFSWDAEEFDTDAFWDVASPSRFTIPAGVAKIRLRGSLQVDSSDEPANSQFTFAKNGLISGFGVGNNVTQFPSTGYTNPGVNLVSGVLDVVEGDYFELMYHLSASVAIENANGTSWFEIEVLEGSVLG